MKILIINWQDIKNPFGGGAEVHLHEIFKRIAKKGHQVTQYSCKIDGEPDSEIIDGIKIIRSGSRNLFNFTVKKMYKERFSKENFDIIIDDINKIPFYTPRYIKEPLLAISHHFFGKSIFYEANFISGLYVYFSEWLMNFVYKNTPFAVVSQSTLDEFINKGFDKNNFKIIFNAIEHNDFPMKVTAKSDVPIITYFGRLKKYKSVDHLFHAFAIVNKQFPQAKLHILGRGDFRPYLEKLAIELNIVNNVKFFGFVSEEDKKKLLAESYCMVNTSLKEGWGITNIEANACGTPVISSNVPGLRVSVSNGLSGMLYEYGNIEQLAELLKTLISDAELRNKLSMGAVEWAYRFSWEESANLMIDLCNEVIANHKNNS